jgi:broad specificity phosphatase PhoE
MDLGDWEGMLYTDIDARFSHVLGQRERDPLHTRAPQGESPMDVAKRALPAMDEIAVRHCDEQVLVVAHGITLAVILCVARGIPLEQLYEHIPQNATLLYMPWKAPRYMDELIRQNYSVV